MENRKPANLIRKNKYVPGVGRVLTMGDARQIVVNPTKRFKNCSKLIDAIFKAKCQTNGKEKHKNIH